MSEDFTMRPEGILVVGYLLFAFGGGG
jgi:hypothetical protein